MMMSSVTEQPPSPQDQTYSANLARDVEARTVELKAMNQALQRELEMRNSAEQELRDSNAQLSNALVEIKQMQKRIIQYQRLDALQQMIRGLAHDINNALMPIVGLSEFIISTPSILDNRTELIGCLQDIRKSATDARKVVRSLREFYRSADAAEMLEVDVNECIKRAVSFTMPLWQEEARARGNRIDVQTDLKPLKTVFASEVELGDVFTNLIINAVDALGDKGGEIRIRSWMIDEKWAVAQVTDNGSGMTEDVKQRCLEPFFTTKGPQRLGLGLSVVHGSVQRCKGFIDVSNREGHGCAVTLRLPVAEESGILSAESLAPIALPPMSILTIDDDLGSANFVRRCLVQNGHTVVMTHSGEEGLSRFATGAFDIVITDRAMSDMNGDRIARMIKSSHPATPVLLLTGFGELMKEKGERPDGVDVILGKPVTDKELLAGIAEAVRVSRGST